MKDHADVIIIGSGTAGLSALREVRKATDDFLVINEGDWGTTCAARGCMPSKALIEAANAFHRRHDFAAFGIGGAESVTVDIPSVLERVRRLRDGFVKGPESVPGELGERAVSGRARLLGPDRVVVEGRELTARRIILAPGSRPVVPGAWARFGDRILTTDSLFEQPDLPGRVAVVGLGAVGVEMAQALSRLGVEVAGFDALESLAGLSDPEVSAAFREALGREFPVHLGAPAELSEVDGGIAVTGAAGSFTADAVLAAMGRRPNIDDFGLDTLGVELDEKGMPPVDPSTLQIGDLPVWLVGDANGQAAILHEAADEGHIAGRNATAEAPTAYCRRTALAVVFSSPGVARVGTAWSDLDPDTIAVGAADFTKQARARTAERAEGLMRIYADKDSGRLTGAEMCVPDAEHMAHLLALAMHRELTVHELLGMPFYHPVLEEGLRGALRDLAREVPGGSASDLSECTEPGSHVPA
ncbi:MAG: dihydrolipoyl dehydrogenase [Gemmatimonadota bacterium]|nr:dihydrolipoyl dehydrogenase [Gemmatimonadota bacterium]